jgi:hypothetical protein
MPNFVIRLLAVLGFAAAASVAYAQSSPCPGNMASYFNL